MHNEEERYQKNLAHRYYPILTRMITWKHASLRVTRVQNEKQCQRESSDVF
jgi:hypothetical protein